MQFGSCKFSLSQVGATISPKYAVTRIPSGDVNTAMAYLANRTALSASLDYVSFEFEHYQKYIKSCFYTCFERVSEVLSNSIKLLYKVCFKFNISVEGLFLQDHAQDSMVMRLQLWAMERRPTALTTGYNYYHFYSL